MKNKKEIINLYNKGITNSKISDITGYSLSTVKKYLYKENKDLINLKRKGLQKININQEQKEILFGTLLGDSYLRKGHHNYYGRINHSILQKDYMFLLKEKLNNLSTEIQDYSIYNKQQNKEYNNLRLHLKSNYNLKYIYDLFYKNGIKTIPNDLSLLTPKAMAYWFMDDGYPASKCTIGIATCSFELDDLLRLKNFLNKKYNIDITITKEFKLYFPKESAIIFKDLTEKYIIDSMFYKFKFL